MYDIWSSSRGTDFGNKKINKNKTPFFPYTKTSSSFGTNLGCLDELKKHKFLKKRNSFIKVLHRYAFLPHKILPTKYPFAKKLKIFDASKQDLFWYLWENFKRQSYTKIYHFFNFFFRGDALVMIWKCIIFWKNKTVL